MTTYSEKLRDPRWQKRRLEILERDEWTCQMCSCTSDPLVVHHRYYKQGEEPWEAEDAALVTLCELCHDIEGSTRPDYENTLISTLREKFYAAEILDLAYAISLLKFPPGFIEAQEFIAMLNWLFRHTEIQEELMSRKEVELHGKRTA